MAIGQSRNDRMMWNSGKIRIQTAYKTLLNQANEIQWRDLI